MHIVGRSIQLLLLLCAATGLIALPAGEAAAQQSACVSSIKGKIAYDGRKNMNWPAESLATLCRGAESSTEPGACFNRVMTSGQISWGASSQWNPANAVRLCAGATSSQARLSCFQQRIAAKTPWAKAADECVQQPQVALRAAPPTAKAPTAPAKQAAGTTAAATAAGNAETQEMAMKTAIDFTCKAPLEVSYLTNWRGAPGLQNFVMNFVGADGPRNLQPGQCWRSRGWDFPRALGGNRRGRVVFDYPLGNCPLLHSFRFKDGKVVDLKMTTRGNGGRLAQPFMDAALKPGETIRFEAVFAFGPNPGIAESTYQIYVFKGDVSTPIDCD